MKWLTLNTHSWMEENMEDKMDSLVQFILSNELDGLSLQEVNQRIDASVDEAPLHFISSLNETSTIKKDNYALCLVKRLAELGETYYWSWTYSHVGYDIYEEGVAILSKKPLQPYAILVSSVDEITDVKRRMLLCAKLKISGKEVLITSSHYSWWTHEKNQGFQLEWFLSTQFLDTVSCPKLLFGDFNGPDTVEGETYDLVTESFLDASKGAKKVVGYHTIPEKIDGWQQSTEKLRIDYVFTSVPLQVRTYEVVFDGNLSACVSDHYGIMIHVDL